MADDLTRLMESQARTLAMLHEAESRERELTQERAALALVASQLTEALEAAGTDLIGFEGYFERLGSTGTSQSIGRTLAKIAACLAAPQPEAVARATALLVLMDAMAAERIDAVDTLGYIWCLQCMERWKPPVEPETHSATCLIGQYRRARRGRGEAQAE